MAGTQNKLVKAIKMVNNWNCTRLTSPIYRHVFIDICGFYYIIMIRDNLICKIKYQI